MPPGRRPDMRRPRFARRNLVLAWCRGAFLPRRASRCFDLARRRDARRRARGASAVNDDLAGRTFERTDPIVQSLEVVEQHAVGRGGGRRELRVTRVFRQAQPDLGRVPISGGPVVTADATELQLDRGYESVLLQNKLAG